MPIANFVQRTPARTTGILTRIDGAAHGDRRGRHPRRGPGRPGAPGGRRGRRRRWASTPRASAGRWPARTRSRRRPAPSSPTPSLAAVALIFAVLLAQFNNFVSVFLVLSAVVMSTIGVFLGLLIMGQPFGIVMTGIGIIALAGVVVNNNIVLIDTYDQLRREGAAKIAGDPADLPRARAAGGADRRDRDPRRAADRLRAQPRAHEPRDHDRRALDPVVDLAVERHRLRARLLHRADAGGDAGDADALHPRAPRFPHPRLGRGSAPVPRAPRRSAPAGQRWTAWSPTSAPWRATTPGPTTGCSRPARPRAAAFAATRTSFFPSLRRTLNHLYAVDVYYLDALRGDRPRPRDLQRPTPTSPSPPRSAPPRPPPIAG